jgi:putative membrane protein
MSCKRYLAAGCLVLATVWFGPLLTGAHYGFTGHMAVHVGLVAIAAPLLAVGLAGSRLDPTPHAPLLFAPVLAAALEFVVVWGWHAPVLHDAARAGGAVLVAEQLSFLAVGMLVWLAAFGRGRGPARATWASGIMALFLTSMHMTLLGALLALSPRLLYGHGHAGIAGDGILCFRVEERPESGPKTESSERVVPLPETLLRLGFREWWFDSFHFPGPLLFRSATTSRRDGKASGNFGKRRTTLWTHFGIADWNEDGYALRRTFLTGLDLAGASDAIRHAIAGHEQGEVSNRHYTETNLGKLKG